MAADRGYDGTSIALVSAASGLPASSIYHHFRDKDGLISAVIEHTFTRWRAAIDVPELHAVDANGRDMALGEAVAKALLDTPEFLRLGLMLALERRPEEPTARRTFLDVRQAGFQLVVDTVLSLLPDLDAETSRPRRPCRTTTRTRAASSSIDHGGPKAPEHLHGRAAQPDTFR